MLPRRLTLGTRFDLFLVFPDVQGAAIPPARGMRMRVGDVTQANGANPVSFGTSTLEP